MESTKGSGPVKIVFTGYNTYSGIEYEDIYCVDSDGSDLIRLIDNPAEDGILYDNMGPCFNSDKSKIVFMSTRGGGGFINLFVLDLAPGRITQITDGYEYSSPCLSPDDRSIVCDYIPDPATRSQILVMGHDGSDQIPVTDLPGINFEPVWSPDGAKIAFVNQPDPEVRHISHIWIMNPDGSSPEQVTRTDTRNDCPTWSPDSAYLAFRSYQGSGGDFYRINPATGEIVQLTDTPFNDVGPVWSAHGIAFSSDREWRHLPGRHDIFTMDPDGGNVQRVTRTERDEYMGSW